MIICRISRHSQLLSYRPIRPPHTYRYFAHLCQCLTMASRRFARSRCLFVIPVVCVLSAAQTLSRPAVIKMYEASVDLRPSGVTIHKCAVVLPEGLLHVEIRRQQLPQRRAVRSVYEYSLSKRQLEALKTVLIDEKLSNSPPFEKPTRPFAVPYFRGFYATISREQGKQSVGYFSSNSEFEASPAWTYSASRDVIQRWKKSQTTLVPLVTWLHEAISMPLPKSTKGSHACGTDPF